MRPFISLIALGAALLALAGPVAAQQPTQAQASAIRQACRADYQSHCASVPTGGSAALQCLQDNAAALSAGCQRALSAVGGGASGAAPPSNGAASAPPPPQAAAPISPRQEMGLLRASCRTDFREFCAGVQPGGGRAVACLHAHGPQLSHQCRSALLALRQSR